MAAIPWDPVPWAVEGGASHSADMARLLAYNAYRGNEGILGALDLRVKALTVPGPQVKVAVGAASILNRAASKPYQAYAASLPSEDTADITATGAGVTRSDLIIARVENPYLPGESWTPPGVPANGPYIFTRVISGVAANTTSIRQVRPNDSAITLARIDIPAATSAITNAMIVDLRTIANPRRQREQFILPGAASSSLSSATYVNWPTGASWSIAVPEWATTAKVRLDLTGLILTTGGQSYGNIRVALGGLSGQPYVYSNTSAYNFDSAASTLRLPAMTAGPLTIPAGMRGTTQTVRAEGTRDAAATRNLTFDTAATAIVEIEFFEAAAAA